MHVCLKEYTPKDSIPQLALSFPLHFSQLKSRQWEGGDNDAGLNVNGTGLATALRIST